MIRTYTELSRLTTLEERYRYLQLSGRVGDQTFGFDRYVNQQFYRSAEWRRLRHHVIARDMGCDLGVQGYEIHNSPYIHHMNPMTLDQIVHGDESILDPEFLVVVTMQTHNAIHYGDASLLPQTVVERRPGDTKLW
jgi:hypothetical protein